MPERWQLTGQVLVACNCNPVSGAEAYPGVVLPQGIIVKHADLGATTRFRVSCGVEYDHSGQYMTVGPFDYAST